MRPALLAGLLALAAASWPAAQVRPPVLSRLVWLDRAGQRIGALGPVADHGNLELSPDNERVAVAVTDRSRGTRDIWVYDARTGARTQFTSDPADENWLIWSPDGASVMLNSFAPDHLVLLQGPATGVPPLATVLEGSEGTWPVSWSPDGRNVLYVTNGPRTSNDIWVLPLAEGGLPYPFLRTEASENWAAFSPDGRWVAFSATVSGQPEVFVSPFPTGPRRRISADGGTQARWRRDGREIFYLAPDNSLMAAAITLSADGVVVDGYERLARLSHPYGAYHAFDVTADGQRFLVNTLVASATQPGVSAALARAPR